tara:strand:+ start:89 stop:379 length:291 start_codon:yes stop_codon:yes gene_type:complete
MNKNSESKWALLRKGLKKLIREQHRKDEGLWKCEYCGWPTSTDKFKCDKCLNICKFRVLVRRVQKAAEERKKEAVLREKTAKEAEKSVFKMEHNLF